PGAVPVGLQPLQAPARRGRAARRGRGMIGEWLARAGLALLRLLARLPFGALRRIGILAGDLLWVLARPRRRITLTNLRLCFPDWTEARRRAVARGHFRAYARSFFDRFVFWFEPE